MSARYTLKVVSDFAAAHALRDYAGACKRLHGHNWKIEVEAQAKELDEAGMAIDFKVLKAHTNEVSARLDHQNLNEITPFDKINPTAENIARFFYLEINKLIKNFNTKVIAVTIWETERASAKYTEE